MPNISRISIRTLSRFLSQNRCSLCSGNRLLLLSGLCLLSACGSGTREALSPDTPLTPVATPTLTTAVGTSFASTLSVSIVDATTGATIYYTTDGSAPSTSSRMYTGPCFLMD